MESLKSIYLPGTGFDHGKCLIRHANTVMNCSFIFWLTPKFSNSITARNIVPLFSFSGSSPHDNRTHTGNKATPTLSIHALSPRKNGKAELQAR
jgi:hypothetical protein